MYIDQLNGGYNRVTRLVLQFSFHCDLTEKKCVESFKGSLSDPHIFGHFTDPGNCAEKSLRTVKCLQKLVI